MLLERLPMIQTGTAPLIFTNSLADRSTQGPGTSIRFDQKFYPRLLYEETNFFNFGKIHIDGTTGMLTVEIRDPEGKIDYSLTLPAASRTGAAH